MGSDFPQQVLLAVKQIAATAQAAKRLRHFPGEFGVLRIHERPAPVDRAVTGGVPHRSESDRHQRRHRTLGRRHGLLTDGLADGRAVGAADRDRLAQVFHPSAAAVT
ncbi:hypothetical protein [Streptomyces sp. NPDC090021]|uniref:hypothetical protein n=1 Tax=Streptomyces sp. NPDC090021 TaxID=3365919 RepID=UPI0037F1238B